MRRKFTISLSIVILVVLFINVQLFAQTQGSLSFSVTTTSTGNFSPKHVVAIWIEKSDGTFIKTKLKRAATRVQYLNQWVSKSGSNVTDATTSATITAHQTESIVWNGTDVNAQVVADGNYKLWIQMAWANSNGPTYSIDFTKGTTASNLTPTNQTNYLNMTLDWVPAVGVADVQKPAIFSVFPNPVTNQSKINYRLDAIADVTISLYDVTGKLVNVLFDENQAAGSYSLSVSAEGRLSPGIYFVKMNSGKVQHTEKIIITE